MGASLFITIQLILVAHETFLHPLEKVCSPGHYLDNASGDCKECPYGTYTQRNNRERQCHHCSRDCKPEFNMEVVEVCSKSSNVRCRCKAGHSCTKKDSFTNMCSRCEKTLTPTPTGNEVTVTKIPRTTKRSSCNSGFYLGSSGRCERHTDCASRGLKVQTAGNTTHDTICDSRHSLLSGDAGMQWWVILVMICIAVFVALILFTLLYSRRENFCLKQLLKSCYPGTDKAAINETTLHKPRGPVATVNYQESHPDTLPSASPSHSPGISQPGTLGPLYIHHPSTVFVSLLNQFGLGGGGGGGGGGGREEERERAENGNPRAEKDETPSPPSPIPLSTEERNREEETSVPFQEQGKESHVSKEEEF